MHNQIQAIKAHEQSFILTENTKVLWNVHDTSVLSNANFSRYGISHSIAGHSEKYLVKIKK